MPKPTSQQKMIARATELITHNLFLPVIDKERYKNELEMMNTDELRELIDILEKSDDDIATILQKVLGTDPDGNIWKKLMSFKNNKMTEIASVVKKQDEEKATKELEKELTNVDNT